MTYEVTIDGKSHRLELEQVDGVWQCKLDNRELRLDAVLTRKDVISVLIVGRLTKSNASALPATCTYGSEVNGSRRSCAIHDPSVGEKAGQLTSMARRSWLRLCREKW
ncbi:MAG TPA: hypothetical protein VH744_13550 [Terriglobales bacterium]